MSRAARDRGEACWHGAARPTAPDPLRLASRSTDVALAEADWGSHRAFADPTSIPLPGTRVPTSSPLTLATRCRALQLRLPGAHFSGPTAALLYGAPLPLALEQSRVVHVAVQEGRRAPTGRHIRGHALRFEPTDVRFVQGVRASTPARLWCELGAALGLADLVAVGDYLIHHRNPLASLRELAAAVTDYPGRRGLRRLREALPLLDDRAESPQESRVRVILVLAGITGFRANHRVTTTSWQALPDRHRVPDAEART